MDYNNLKKDDVIYLSYRVGPRGFNVDQSHMHTIITFPNSSERMHIFESNDTRKYTRTIDAHPVNYIIGVSAYLLAIGFWPNIIGTSTLGLTFVPIFFLISSYFLGAFSRKLCGPNPRKIDVFNCEKISVEEIKEKHMNKIWENFKGEVFYWILITILLLFIGFFAEKANHPTSPHIIYWISAGLGSWLYFFRYLNIFNRYKSMKQIEKEYNLNRKNNIYSLEGDKFKTLYLSSKDYVYLPMIDKPVRFLLGYPDVTSIVTFKNNNDKFVVSEKGEVFNKPKTITFPRRTIWIFAWAIYFLIILNSPTTVTENLLVMQMISFIPLIIGLISLWVLVNSIDGNGNLEVANLEQISATRIKEEYLKKIQKNLRVDFFNSFVWIAYLIFIPINTTITNQIDLLQLLGLLGIVFMLILRFINIYRRVVAVKEIEKECNEL